MRITITMDVSDDLVDHEDSSGLNEAAYNQIWTRLSEYGEDIDITKVDA